MDKFGDASVGTRGRRVKSGYSGASMGGGGEDKVVTNDPNNDTRMSSFGSINTRSKSAWWRQKTMEHSNHCHVEDRPQSKQVTTASNFHSQYPKQANKCHERHTRFCDSLMFLFAEPLTGTGRQEGQDGRHRNCSVLADSWACGLGRAQLVSGF